ncbi:MAG: hypothetical protein K0Q73_7311 [Paenibacillus sp.]|nr:hypothetical protein [Paenibacillus sp.]
MKLRLHKKFFRRKSSWAAIFFIALLLLIGQVGTTTALFTDSVANSNNIMATARLSVATSPATALINVSNLVPGDTITRTIDVQNTGTVSFTYKITNSSSTNTLLWTNKTNGLQLDIKQGAATYYTGPISDLNVNIAPDLNLTASSTHTLTFTISFPVLADNTFQQLSETIAFTFSATQLPGAAR